MNAHLQATPEPRRALPLTAKIAAIYLIVAGATSIPLLFVAPPAEFLVQPVASRAGYYTRVIMLDIAFIVAGVAVLQRRSWARKLGVTVLVISAIYGAFAFGRGFAQGAPSPKVLLISFVVVGAWSALWIYLLCRKSRLDVTRNA